MLNPKIIDNTFKNIALKVAPNTITNPILRLLLSTYNKIAEPKQNINKNAYAKNIIMTPNNRYQMDVNR